MRCSVLCHSLSWGQNSITFRHSFPAKDETLETNKVAVLTQGPRSGFSSGGRGGGGLVRTRKREQTRGFRGENFKFKSSEMAINSSKTANSNINS